MNLTHLCGYLPLECGATKPTRSNVILKDIAYTGGARSSGHPVNTKIIMKLLNVSVHSRFSLILGISQTDSWLKQLVLPKLCSHTQGCQKESLSSSDCMSHFPFHSCRLLIPSLLALCQSVLFVIRVAQATTVINFSPWQFNFRHIATL